MPAYKNDAGRWYCAFYCQDWTGKRRKKKKESFATKREALEWERRYIEEQAGTPTMSFEALYGLYKKDCTCHLKKSTMISKFAMIDKHILPRFRQLCITEITPATVRAWQTEVLGKGYSQSYCYSLHRQLSAILNFACRYYGLPTNPAARAGSIGCNEVHQAFWTLDDFHRFAMTLTEPAQIMLFYMLFWTGCRIGEVLALTWDDVDGDSIHITKTLSYLHGSAYVRPPKTRESNRTVKLPSFVVAMLAGLQAPHTVRRPEALPHDKLGRRPPARSPRGAGRYRAHPAARSAPLPRLYAHPGRRARHRHRRAPRTQKYTDHAPRLCPPLPVDKGRSRVCT